MQKFVEDIDDIQNFNLIDKKNIKTLQLCKLRIHGPYPKK